MSKIKAGLLYHWDSMVSEHIGVSAGASYYGVPSPSAMIVVVVCLISLVAVL